MSEQKQEDLERAGCGPAFDVADFPEPPKIKSARALLAIMGPAVIALGGMIGGGERLIGPLMFVKYGLVLLWITAVSLTLQAFLITCTII